MKNPAFKVGSAHWFLAAMLAGVVLNLAGQNYSLDWHKIAGGGGTSTNGQYAVTGTIAQADGGGAMTNGQFSVTGGFWAISAIQTEGAPRLAIVPGAPGFALISWAPNSAGFVLQETHDLSSTNWINSPSGATNQVVVPASTPVKYYRLNRQ